MKTTTIKILLLLFLTGSLVSQWQTDMRLTNTTPHSYCSGAGSWSIAASGDTLHAVWYETLTGVTNREIYYLRSTDGGATWSAIIRLTNDPGLSYYPAITCSGSTVHVVWTDDRGGSNSIWYKRSTDAGNTWGTDTKINQSGAGGGLSSIVSSGQNVRVVWHDKYFNPLSISYIKSTDGGATWSTEIVLTTSSNSAAPCCAISGLNEHVVWADNRDGNFEIYYKRSIDGGNTWGTDTRLTVDAGSSTTPCITAAGNNLHVVWDDTRDGNDEIYYKRSTDGGLTWSADTRMTVASGFSSGPNLSLNGNNVNLFWMDNRGTSSQQLYYKTSTDNGITWSTDLRMTTTSSYSLNPSSVFSGNKLHVLWYDGRDGNAELYYNRKLPPQPPNAPSNLIVSASAGRKLQLAWTNPVPVPDSIIIYRGYGNNLARFKTISGSNTSLLDTGLVNNVIYKYKVYALNSVGVSLPSNLASDTTYSVSGSTSILNSESGSFTIPSNGILTRSFSLSALDHINANSITDVNLLIDSLTHTKISDLEITLVHGGVTDTLFYHNGGAGQNMLGTYFTGSGDTSISTGSAPYRGFYIPLKSLTQFNSQDYIGNWTLNIKDTVSGNTGTLYSWTLSVQYTQFTEVQNSGTGIPADYKLSQNYPNPFNPSTKISFDLPKQSLTTITIFDITGREVSKPVNEMLNAGKYEVNFDASKFASGVYFYKIESSEFSDVKKMMLIK